MSYQVKRVFWPKKLIGIYAALVFLFILDYGGWASWLRKSVIWSMRPLTNVSTEVVEQSQRIERYLEQMHNQALRNLDMQREIAELRVLADRTKILEDENKYLALQAKVLQDDNTSFVMGEIVAKGNKWRVYVQVEVPVGSMVLYNSRVVGVVTSSYSNICEVAPVGTKGAELELRLNGGGVVGKIENRGSVLEISNVAKDMTINVSDLLVTTAEFGLVAPGYPVTLVSEIIETPESISSTVRTSGLPNIAIGERVLIGGIKP